MRIVESPPNVVSCPKCKAKLEYEATDVDIGEYGIAYIKCLSCSQDIYLENSPHSIILTPENIEFPRHFCSISPGANVLTDGTINKLVKDCIDVLKKSSADIGEYAFICLGDTFVFAVKYDDEYMINVARDYYMSSIPR